MRPKAEQGGTTATAEAGPKRAVVARGERVPFPRRLIGAALLFAILAVALHSMPRPYQPIRIGVLLELRGGYDHLRAVYRAGPGGEPVAGEVTPEEASSHQWELWRHTWLGLFREIALRVSEGSIVLCLFGAMLIAGNQWKHARRSAIARGAQLAPKTIHTETLKPVGTAQPSFDKPDQPPPVQVRTAAAAAPAPYAYREMTPIAPGADDDDEQTPVGPAAVLPVPVSAAPAISPIPSPPQEIPTDPLMHTAPDEQLVVRPGEPSIPPVVDEAEELSVTVTSAAPAVLEPAPTPIVPLTPISSPAPEPATKEIASNPGWWPKPED